MIPKFYTSFILWNDPENFSDPMREFIQSSISSSFPKSNYFFFWVKPFTIAEREYFASQHQKF